MYSYRLRSHLWCSTWKANILTQRYCLARAMAKELSKLKKCHICNFYQLWDFLWIRCKMISALYAAPIVWIALHHIRSVLVCLIQQWTHFKMHCNCGDQDDLDYYEETRLLAFFSKAQLYMLWKPLHFGSRLLPQEEKILYQWHHVFDRKLIVNFGFWRTIVWPKGSRSTFISLATIITKPQQTEQK